ncbi:MAG: serine/threonine protein kinase [Chlamydiales bacterium]|jgi:serine/threonine protein kinase
MTLSAGQSISFYEILGPLGAGAMGEVYQARDSRLDRDVAIKVLPAHFAEDEERLKRFEREAKSIASLNHPNVAQIYSVDQIEDTCFLVLELVPGETLEDRIARGALPIDEAVDICRQIAEGLEAAHDAGVIHRDLKPANVRITPDGKVKVLDFGLAKPTGFGSEDGSSKDSVLATEEGRLLGTPIYMAPEQARGKPIDRRVDVWAFGCVMFECLTGKRAFDGESMPDVLAAVMRETADFSRLPASTPAHVRELVERCLEKDSRQRLRDVGEARITLELSGPEPGDLASLQQAAAPKRSPLFGPLGWALGALVGGLAVFGTLRTEPDERPEPIVLSGLTSSGSDSVPSPSPDGRLIAFQSERDGRLRIWLKQLETGSEQVLSEGPDRAPRFAPNGNSILFLRAEGDRQNVYRQALLGSEARKIADDVTAACWSPDGGLVGVVRITRESEQPEYGILIVDVRTGEERELYRTEVGELLYSLRWSPDGSVLSAGTGAQTGQSSDQSAIVLVPVDGGEVERFAVPGPAMHDHDWIGGDGRRVVYTQSWQSVGDMGGSLSRVVLWDLDRGDRRDLFHAEYLNANLGSLTSAAPGASITVVKDETLVYTSTFVRQLLFEQDIQAGRAVAPGRLLIEGQARDRQPVYSPDGSRVYFASNRTGNLDLWEIELESGQLSQLTDDRAQDWDPSVSADGKQLLWSSDRAGVFEIWSAAIDGSSARQLSADGVDAENPSMAQGGEWVLYWSANPEKRGVWRMRPDGASPERIVEGNYSQSEVSSDGLWVGFIIQEPHKLRSVLRFAEVKTGRVLPFEVLVSSRSTREESVTHGRMRWVSNCALSEKLAVAFIGVDAEGRTGVFLQAFDPEEDTSATRRPLAGFHDDLVTESFGIAPDGTRITLSCVEVTRKLMLAERVNGILAPHAQSEKQ